MTETEIRKKLRLQVQRYVPRAQLTDSVDIFAEGFVNSLVSLELLSNMEQQFRITVPDRDRTLNNFRSIDSMTELVLRLDR